jgi:hypothetical protein
MDEPVNAGSDSEQDEGDAVHEEQQPGQGKRHSHQRQADHREPAEPLTGDHVAGGASSPDRTTDIGRQPGEECSQDQQGLHDAQ